MSDHPTPITDAFAYSLSRSKVPESRCWPYWLKHSRDLERQLAEARREAEAQRDSAHLAWVERGDTSDKELLPWEMKHTKHSALATLDRKEES